MSEFVLRKKDGLHFGNINIAEILKTKKTPFYLYSKDVLSQNFLAFKQAAENAGIHDHKICFAVKANANIAFLKTLKRLGSGVDIVSGGELEQSLKAGFSGSDVVFSGVGKTESEIKLALKKSIYSFNVESLEELEMIHFWATKLKKTANISFRLNPQVIAKTHKHISTGNTTHKFGILDLDIIKASKKKKYWSSHCKLVGLSIHIGSQLTCLKATGKAVKNLAECAYEITDDISFLDVGGGLGVAYHPDQKNNIPNLDDYMGLISSKVKKHYKKLPQIVFEPGRIIAATAGAFITSVIRNKKSENHRFVIVDGGMNDFVRPSLYSAYHEIISGKKGKTYPTNIVGPICETADCFGTDRQLPNLKEGDFLLIADAGAYGHTMSSNYNMRQRPKEFLL